MLTQHVSCALVFQRPSQSTKVHVSLHSSQKDLHSGTLGGPAGFALFVSSLTHLASDPASGPPKTTSTPILCREGLQQSSQAAWPLALQHCC